MTGLTLVTGAGTGLGRALAVELTRRGERVVGLGRREGPLEETATLAGPAFRPLPCDIADPTALRAAIAALDAPVTRLINNAATYPRRDILEETAESFMATVATNLGGMVACCEAVLPGMVARGEGRILNVTTFADLAPLPTAAAYSVSKGAARIFTRALVADLADRFPRIVVNDWIPGALATEMGLPDGIPPEEAARWGATLALSDDPTLTGTLWDRDREVTPPRSLNRRLAERLRLAPSQPARRL